MRHSLRCWSTAALRRGEALALHWSDIDFAAKVLRVRGTLAGTSLSRAGEILNSRPLDPQMGGLVNNWAVEPGALIVGKAGRGPSCLLAALVGPSWA
jgi:integrase